MSGTGSTSAASPRQTPSAATPPWTVTTAGRYRRSRRSSCPRTKKAVKSHQPAFSPSWKRSEARPKRSPPHPVLSPQNPQPISAPEERVNKQTGRPNRSTPHDNQRTRHRALLADGQACQPATEAGAEHAAPLRRPALLGVRGTPVPLSAMATLPVGSTGTPSFAGPTRAPMLGHRCGRQKRLLHGGGKLCRRWPTGGGGGASILGDTPPPSPEPRPDSPATHPTCTKPRLPLRPVSLRTLTSPWT